ncbi:LacI family DNA-binding transcriptional regulator [Anaeromicropila populeti]|uniref:Transcriptional regulator, LacI family n=1 Tax=Anaeromicropila populeti TaxID=37658 RepID=A0A1I6HUR2_9FIRM|nr:LacI family DNA-binding transcriptional regulator [Anaeromicropila populeti]SFR58148.1 transcriptional regulator, LacI family [Anaeromicropila populeti]
MATLKDVARETGLTVSTVSRVLNNRGYISEETRKKVYEAMKKLNYQPNEVARSLSKQVTNTIGVIVPHIRHPYFAELISCIENAANKKKHKILLFNSKDRDEKEMEFLDMCISNRVAGVILCSGSVAMESFQGINVPLITIERNLEGGTAAVECDNLQGGRLAASHLIECGCKKIVHISGVSGISMPADDREVGFVEVCNEKRVEHLEVKTDFKLYNAGYYNEFLEEVLLNHTDIDGIFASSDLIAAQILQVCAKLKIAVPEQIKIVGFDDVLIASLTAPSITTIHQPIKEMAGMAISLLLDAAENKVVPNKVTLPVTLVERQST